VSRAIKDLGSPLSPRAKEVKRSALGSPLTLIVLRAVVSLIAWTRTPLFPFSFFSFSLHWTLDSCACYLIRVQRRSLDRLFHLLLYTADIHSVATYPPPHSFYRSYIYSSDPKLQHIPSIVRARSRSVDACIISYLTSTRLTVGYIHTYIVFA